MDSVDNRIVSMRFDNKQFKSGVSDTIKAIDKLEDKLSFKGVKDGFGKIASSIKDISFKNVERGIDTVVAKIPLMDKIWDQTVRAMTMKTINFVDNLISQFGLVQEITAGFQEYETQMNAVQTILANTSSKGTTLEQVNAALDELNTYADKTIYNFTEMTRNIGTFTAAGVDLDTSVKAIKGIANLAAVSGSTSQQASTAMYQLSQALASGTVKLMDWNSVVNAGMGGQVFQDALKQTARAMGISVDEIIEANGSFRDSLSTGWLTSEVLTETLAHFTYSMEDMTAAEIAQAQASLEAQGYTSDQIKQLFDLGQTATDAATKVKTFTQLIDTLKESLQSGWTQTWEYVIGDFETAKSMWTSVSDTIQSMIQPSIDARNDMLKYWAESGKIDEDAVEKAREMEQHQKAINEAAKDIWYNGDKANQSRADYLASIGLDPAEVQAQIDKLAQGIDIDSEQITNDFDVIISGRDMVIQGFSNIWKNVKYAIDFIRNAWQEVFPPKTGKELVSISERFLDWTERIKLTNEQLHDIRKIFRGVFSALSILKTGFKLSAKAAKGFIDGLFGGSNGSGLRKFLAWLGDLITGVDKSTKNAESLSDIFYKFGQTAGKVVSGLVKGIVGIISVLGDLADALGFKDKIIDTVEKIKELVKSFDFEEAKERISDFVNIVKDKFTAFKNGDITLKDFVSNIKDEAGKVTDAEGPFGAFKEFVDNWLTGWRSMSIEPLKHFCDKISEVFRGIDFGYAEYIWEDIKDVFKNLFDALKNGSDSLVDWSKDATFEDQMEALSKAGGIYALFTFANMIRNLGDLFGNSSETIGKLGGVFKSLKKLINSYNSKIRVGNIFKLSIAIGIITASIVTLTTLSVVDEDGITRSLTALGIVLTAMVGVMVVVNRLMNVAGNIKDPKIISSASGLLISMAASLFVIFHIINKLTEFFDKGTDPTAQYAIFASAALVIMLILGGMAELAVYASSKSSAIKGVGTTLLTMALSLYIIIDVAKRLGEAMWSDSNFDTDYFVKALGFIAILMTGMALLAKLMSSQTKGMIGVATAITSLALAVKMIVGSITTLSLLDTKLNIDDAFNGIIKIIWSLGGVMALLAILSSGHKVGILSSSQSVFKGLASAFIGLAIAVNLMIVPLSILSVIPIDSWLKGIGSLILIIGSMATAITLTGKFGTNQINGESVTKTAASFVILAAAVLIMTKSVKDLSKLNPGTMTSSIISIMGIMLSLSFAMETVAKSGNTSKAMITATSMSVIILLLSNLTKNLSSLAKNDWKRIVTAGGALTLVVAAIGGIVSLMSKLTDTTDIIMTSAAFIGIAFGITLFAKALGTLSQIDPTNLKSCVESLASMLVIVFALTGILAGIGMATGGTFTAALLITAGAIALLGFGVSQIVDAMVTAKEANLKWTDAFGPLSDAIVGIIGVLGTMLESILKLPGAIAETIQAYKDLQEAERSERETRELTVSASKDRNMGEDQSMHNARVDAVAEMVQKFTETGDTDLTYASELQDMYNRLPSSINNAFNNQNESNLNTLVTDLQRVKDLEDKLLGDAGDWQDYWNVSGLDGEVYQSIFTDKTAVSRIKGALQVNGSSLGEVFGEEFADGVCNSLGIHSPSKVFLWIGEMLMNGLANGILSKVGDVGDIFGSLGGNSSKSFMDNFDISSIIDVDSMTTQLTNSIDTKSITDQITKSFNSEEMMSNMDFSKMMPTTDFQSMFSTSGLDTSSVSSIFDGMDTKIGYDASSIFTDMQKFKTESPDTYNDASMQEKMDTLINEMQLYNENRNNMNVVLDSGALVGQLSGGIDKSLGVQSIYKKRS